MTENRKDLKPCPFCGGENIETVLLGGLWRTACGKCGSSGGLCKTEDNSITAWNTRPPADSQAVGEAEAYVSGLYLDYDGYANKNDKYDSQITIIDKLKTHITDLIAKVRELEGEPIGKCYTCGRLLYATLGQCEVCDLQAENKALREQVAGVVKICGNQCKGHKHHNCHGCPVMDIKLRKESV